MPPTPDFLRLHFFGAAGTVTGSKTLVETPRHRLLIDCGLFQGLKPLRELNWNLLPVEAHSIEDVILTHGHLDHTGYLPRLYKAGFRGVVHTNAPTEEIAEIVMRDCGKIQEEDAEEANQRGSSKHSPALPLYTEKDAMAVMTHFARHEAEQWIIINEDFKFRMRRNGHIPGSVAIELRALGRSIIFSGDVGRRESLLLDPPAYPDPADYLILESTYGDRFHDSTPAQDELARVLEDAVQRGGPVIIPSFAVSRAQELLLLIQQLKDEGRCPDWPVVLDSPMAVDVFQVLAAFPDWHQLSLRQIRELSRTAHLIQDFRESRRMVADERPKIVIAGSGMVTGGRVLHYLERWIGDPRATVLLSGYQAEGTRGRDLAEGKPTLKFLGQTFEVRAAVAQLKGLSAHADQDDLVHWVRKIKGPGPGTIFLNHGEPQAAKVLKGVLESTFPSTVHIPAMNEVFEIPL